MNQVLAKAIKHWHFIAPLIEQPHNEKEFNLLVSRLDKILDIVGDDEAHPLMGLVELISNQISAYEKKYQHKISGKGINALKLLMQLHDLHQKDFPEIASQGVLSEILNGKRSLNLRQIKLLAKRFHVDPSTFVDD